MRRLASLDDRPRWAHAVLGLIVLVAAAHVARHGLRIHGMVFYDEKFSVEGARFLHDDPARMLDPKGYAGRGLERLMAIVLLPVVAAFPKTAHQFVAGHLVVALVYALLAVPTYAMARGLELSRRWALGAAAMAVFVPWAVFGTVFVNTGLATTTAMAALWAMWRATLWPSLRADTLALLLLGLTSLARVSHLGLAAGWAVALAVQAWRDAPPGEARRTTLRRLPGRVATAHPLLMAFVGAVAAVLALKGPDAVVGGYPARVDFPIAELWKRIEVMTAHASSGMAFLAFVVAVPWLIRTLASPSDRRSGAFAVLATTMFLSLVYINHLGGFDERYGLPAYAPLFVAFAAALARRQVGATTAVAAGVVAWLCADRWALVGHDSPFQYFDAPASQRLSVAWIPEISETLHVDRRVALGLLVLALTLVAVALARARGRLARRLAVLSVVGTVLAGVSGASYLMIRLPAGYRPDASFSELTFVDEVTGGADANPLVEPGRRDERRRNMWIELQFFNRSIKRPVSIGLPAWTLCCLDHGFPQLIQVDERTGAIDSPDAPMPPYVLTAGGWRRVGLAGERVGAGLGRPRIHVERLRQPPRAAWIAEGATPTGWVRSGDRATVRIFAAALPPAGRACLRVTMQGPAPTVAASSWRSGRARGRLTPGATERRDLAIPRGRDGQVREVVLEAVRGDIRLQDLRVTRCGAPEGIR